MKVYAVEDGQPRLVGRADVLDDGSPVFELRLFGATSIITDPFTIGTVTSQSSGDNGPVVERAILLSPLQRPELLPGWTSLVS